MLMNVATASTFPNTTDSLTMEAKYHGMESMVMPCAKLETTWDVNRRASARLFSMDIGSKAMPLFVSHIVNFQAWMEAQKRHWKN